MKKQILALALVAAIPVTAQASYFNFFKHPAPAPVVVVAPPPAPPAPPPIPKTVIAYNGLLYAEMGPLVAALQKRHFHVKTFWHDSEARSNGCPSYIIGHSMGGNAAIDQAIVCQRAGHPPVAIVVIDAARTSAYVPANAKYKCVSYYNPSHPIGGQRVSGKCTNHIVTGYTHLYMPDAPAVVRGVLGIVK